MPLPHHEVIEHVFGEEKLAANPVWPAAIETYLEEDHPDEAVDATHLDDEDLRWADAFGKRCKLDFPLLCRPENSTLAYLDNAATTQRCFRALQAEQSYYEEDNGNVYRGTYTLSKKSTAAFNNARKAVEAFICAEKNSVAFTMNTTDACNLVAQSWARRHVKAEDLIVIGTPSHHSSIVPFLMVAHEVGAAVDYIPYGDDGRLDRTAYSALMSKRPKLVCISHVSNVLGIVEPVAELAREAHAAGARILLDAAQSLPHVPVDVRKLGVDWLAFSGHKAYGPMGVGCLWFSAEAGSEMDPSTGGGGTVSHVGRQSYYLRTRPIQFELGTPPVAQAVGLAAALDYLDTLGMHDVQKHEAILTRYLVEQLQAIDRITILGDHLSKDGQVGLVSFTVAGIDSMMVVEFLGNFGVASRGGGHCSLPLHACLGLSGTVRLSMGVYTTICDIDKALSALRTLCELL